MILCSLTASANEESTEAAENAEQEYVWDGSTIYDIAPGDDLDELVEFFNGAVVYIYREKSKAKQPDFERILRLMEGTKSRVDSKLKAQPEPTYALGWFRLEIDGFWGVDPDENEEDALTDEQKDAMEPEYLFVAHGSYQNLNFTIDENEFDEQAEMRFASEILKYTAPHVYEITCENIESVSDVDLPVHFIYFGDLEHFQGADAAFSEYAWIDSWRNMPGITY